MAQGYNKSVSGTKAVAPTMDISGLFNTNYTGTVQESTKYQPQEQSIDINIDEYMDIEIKPEEPKKAWYEQLWDAAGEFFSDVGEVLAATGATIAVGATSILSGVLDVGEALVDGVTWVGAAGADLLGFDDAAKDMREFISRDLVGEANKAFYENTAVGQAINGASYMKYDSELAQGIRSTTESVTVFVAATAATVLTGGGAAAVIAPLAAGFAYGAGQKAEEVYQKNGTDTNLSQELGIFVSGVGEAANWYAQGKMGQNGLNLASKLHEVGVGNVLRSAGTGMKNTISTIANRGLNENLSLLKTGVVDLFKGTFNKNNLGKAFVKTLKDVDTLTDSVGIIGDNVAAWLIGEEEFNKDSLLKAGKELGGAYVANLAMNAFSEYLIGGSGADATPGSAHPGTIGPNINPDIQKYLDDYLLDPAVTPPMGIPQELLDYLENYAKNPDITPPVGIPQEIINYLDNKSLKQLLNNVNPDIQKYLDDYLLDPSATPPMGIPQDLLDYLYSYAKDPSITSPNGIPKEIIEYLNKKTGGIPLIDPIQYRQAALAQAKKIDELCKIDMSGMTQQQIRQLDNQISDAIDELFKMGYTQDELAQIIPLRTQINMGGVILNTNQRRIVDQFVQQNGLFLNIDNNGMIPKWQLDNILNQLDSYELSQFNNLFNAGDVSLSQFTSYGANQAAISNLKRTNPEKYKELVDKVRKAYPGMSKQQAVKFLDGINKKGVCSYATTLNQIYLLFDGQEAAFKNAFGFDMYTIDQFGNKVLNDAELLADMYIHMNQDNPEAAKKVFGLFWKSSGTDANQIYMSGVGTVRTDLIGEYLTSKGLNSNASHNMIASSIDKIYQTGTGLDPQAASYIESQVRTSLSRGDTVRLGIYYDNQTNLPLTMRNITNPGIDTVTNNWNEGGGHSILVTGIDTSGNLVVSSWGQKYKINISELIGTKFSIFSNNIQNYT